MESATEKPPALDMAIQILHIERVPLALHEFGIANVSQSALGARLREAKRDGLVFTQQRDGKLFKEWLPAPRPGGWEACSECPFPAGYVASCGVCEPCNTFLARAAARRN